MKRVLISLVFCMPLCSYTGGQLQNRNSTQEPNETPQPTEPPYTDFFQEAHEKCLKCLPGLKYLQSVHKATTTAVNYTLFGHKDFKEL